MQIISNPEMVILFAEKCVASTHAVPQSCKQRETAGAVSNAFENLTAVVEPDVLAFARILPFSIRGKAEFCTRKGIKEWKLEQDRERSYFIAGINKEKCEWKQSYQPAFLQALL